MRKLLTIVLLLSCVSLAQTPKPKTTPVKSKALLQCEADRDEAVKWTENAATLFSEESAKVEKLREANANLAKRLEQVDDLNTKVLAFNQTVIDGHGKLASEYAALVTKYNSLLEQANMAIGQANARLDMARQQRISNALALYSLMPKYTPPVLQPYQFVPNQPVPNRSINCTSNRIGDITYTNCN